ncbi:MAG: tail completion protein gp17 [Beijerinckiaceae bacterium]
MASFPLQPLRKFLLADPAIVTVVGQRIYLLQVEQNAIAPHILLSPITMRGNRELNSYGPASARVQIDIRSSSLDGATGANTIGDLVHTRLEGFRGLLDTLAVERCYNIMDGMLFDDPSRLIRRIIDFEVHFAS